MAGPAVGLTEDEQALIRSIGSFARDFSKLTPLHPADAEEMAFHVHARLHGSWRCAPRTARILT
jgi:hypothetical protein